ncbi:hypothetical protein HNP84_005807 [Thermocatellispora tengchongensis]|uniref:Uncharacterized protein n=1 Tax=Thermocatellispora tengchongensis TaxID=1073253 RepID=A0A840PDQ1_9ACTN|nr:hypothetical protein [Thermocatellispora tengchongensis]
MPGSLLGAADPREDVRAFRAKRRPTLTGRRKRDR